MKNCWIAVNSYFNSNKNIEQIKHFEELFKSNGIDVRIVRVSDIPAYVGSDGTCKCKLPIPDFCLFWDKDIRFAKLLESFNIKLFNSAKAIEICDDKHLTFSYLLNKGIKMPITISSPLLYPANTLTDIQFLKNVEQYLNYPIVIKEVYGSFGKQVYKAKNFDELKEIYERLKYIPHIYQEMINSSYGVDVRLILIGKKCVASAVRRSNVDFRSNVELGGKIEKYSPDYEYVMTAEKIATLIDLDYCSVDFLLGINGEPILCEVNSNAFFKGISEACNIDVARLYVDYIVKCVYGN